MANRSAVGEQFVDLQPQTKTAALPRGRLRDPDRDDPDPDRDHEAAHRPRHHRRARCNKQSLRTVVDELGTAFNGTGPDLGRIIDTSNSFINAANDNFDITTALLEDSNTVLRTQIDKTSAIKSFSRDLSLFSDTVAAQRPGPAPGDRERQRDRQPAALVPGARTRSTSAS